MSRFKIDLLQNQCCFYAPALVLSLSACTQEQPKNKFLFSNFSLPQPILLNLYTIHIITKHRSSLILVASILTFQSYVPLQMEILLNFLFQFFILSLPQPNVMKLICNDYYHNTQIGVASLLLFLSYVHLLCYIQAGASSVSMGHIPHLFVLYFFLCYWYF